MVMNIAKSIFEWIFIFAFTIELCFNNLKKKDAKSSVVEEDKNTKLEFVFLNIVRLSAIAIIFIVCFYVVCNGIDFTWLLIFLGAPLYLNNVVIACSSIGIIRDIVQFKSKDRLSRGEYLAIQIVAFILFCLDSYKLSTKILEALKSIENAFFYDLLYIIVYILFIFLYTFLICALLSRPIILLSKIIIKLNLWLKNNIKLPKIADYFIDQIDKKNIIQLHSIKIINVVKTKCKVIYILVLILSPILIVLDIFINIFKIIFLFLCECIGYILLLVKMIKQTVGKMIVWINNSSDRRMIAISFRIALIVALVLTVIVNRYTPLLREYESSTGVLEFVSSAILIPVIFEWIASIDRKNKNYG